MAIYYIESELSHHGVKGQKWGVRKEQKYLAKEAKYAKKENKARTRFMKNYYGSNRIFNKHMASKQKAYNEAGSLKEKLRLDYGAEGKARNHRYNAEVNKMVASRMKYQSNKRNQRERMAFNNESMARHYDNIAKVSDSSIQRAKYSIKNTYKVPLKNVRNGKKTTYGKQYAKAIAASMAISMVASITSA